MAKQETIFVVAADSYIWSDKFKTLKAAQDYADGQSEGYDVMGIVLGVDGYEYCHGSFFCKKYAEDILKDLNDAETRKQEAAYELKG